MTPALFRFGTYNLLDLQIPTTPDEKRRYELIAENIRSVVQDRTGVLGIQELLGHTKAEVRRLLRHARHHVTVCVTSGWPVMETQHPDRHTCTFERIQELPLGR
ncbi:hypothetical protein [Streptomyces sp. GbtcB6]|uniref:hypothetical protein n=1 Tax=Streptomyces sp. GbtcB6 TaxID=2824751 RepID=UPI001C2FA3EB|nr:hypothetical protein [Streptomyces sp. GbtcB6]